LVRGYERVSISFYGNELIDIAIGIERRGIAFYDVLARSTQSVKAREIFQYLVGMEREHIQIFQGMLDDLDKYEVPQAYEGEYGAYLQALVDSAVFTDDMVTSELATQSESDIAAVELGISAEKDSILFYYEMREIVSKPARAKIDKIIAEEKLHLRRLAELKKVLAA
jgi:rubrerythrin